MRFMVYTTMEFCKEIEADSIEEARNLADDVDYDWEDCWNQTSEVQKVIE